MFTDKVIQYLLYPIVVLIGVANLYLLATQTIWVIASVAIELLVIRYLNKNLRRKATPVENLLIGIMFWVIPVVVYFLVPSTNKKIYILFYQSYFT